MAKRGVVKTTEAEDFSEASPLLVEDPDQPLTSKDVSRDFKARWYQASSPGLVVTLLATIMFILVMTALVCIMPMVRLVEDAMCRRYYNTTEPVDERDCKVTEIQAKMAWLGAISGVLDAVVG